MEGIKLHGLFVGLLFAAYFLSDVTSSPSAGCLRCICGVESNGGNPGCGKISGDKQCGTGCRMDVGSCSCGPYQIKKDYFTDCSAETSLPIKDWQSCSIDVDCATQCVRAYLDRYGEKCTGSTNITCAQYGGIHNGGPKGCNAEKTSGYRKKIENCCQKESCLAIGRNDDL